MVYHVIYRFLRRRYRRYSRCYQQNDSKPTTTRTSKNEILQFSEGLPPPDPPSGQTDGRAGGDPIFWCICFDLFEIFLYVFEGVYKPWEVSHFVRREISRGMH